MEVIKLNVGKSSIISLKSLATSGYLWSFKLDRDDIVSVAEDRDTVVSGSIKAGENFSEKFRVTALKRGSAKLTFTQKRNWEQNTAAISTLIFTAVVS